MEKEVPAASADKSISMQMRTPNLHSLIGPNFIVLFGQLTWSD